MLTGAVLLCWAGLLLPLFSGPASTHDGRDVELVALVVFIIGFLGLRPALRDPRSGRGVVGAIVMTLAGLVATVFSSHDSISPVALCVSAAAVGFALPRRAVWVVLALQTITLIYGVFAGFMDPQWSITFSAMMFFAAMVVEVTVREFYGRLRLAETSDALEEANRSLAEAQRRLADEARNAERLRISRDLHDSVGHRLTALSLKLELAAHLAEGQGPVADQVVESRELVRATLAEVRSVVSRLRAPQVDLRTRLQGLVESSGLAQVSVDVDSASNVGDSGPTQVVYRVVQEALTNVVRHSQASQVQVRVTREEHAVVVSIADDGIGAPDLTPGNGLTGMRERVTHVGGVLTVAPGRLGGLEIVARIPLID